VQVKVPSWVIEMIKVQGLPFLMMMGALWYMYTDLQGVKKEVTDCNRSLIELYKEDNNMMKEVISENTIVLREICNE
jgi:hypothetical protein